MSQVKPVNVLSAKSLQLLSTLQPADQIVLKRGAGFYGLEVTELFEEPTDPESQYTEFYQVTKSFRDPSYFYASYPTVTYTISDWLVEVPTYVEIEDDRNPVVVDVRDVTFSGQSWKALDYIRALEITPVTIDRRGDYIDWSSKPEPPTLRSKPVKPPYDRGHPLYQMAYLKFNDDVKLWNAESALYTEALALYPYRLAQWSAVNDPDKITPDGRHQSVGNTVKVIGRSIVAAQVESSCGTAQQPDLAVALLAIQELNQEIINLKAQIRELNAKVR